LRIGFSLEGQPGDVIYSLGQGIHDGICKYPEFVWSEAAIQLDSGPTIGRHMFNEATPEPLADQLLRVAVRPGDPARLFLLERAITECRTRGRKLIIFLGGHPEYGGIEDATIHLPGELAKLGLSERDYLVVTSEDDDARSRIANFGNSDRWILVTVDMVSEGVDIPELSAALFLSYTTADPKTIQRLGRILRLLSGSAFDDAIIYMFKHPRYVNLSRQILRELHQAELRSGRPRHKRRRRGEGPPTPRLVGNSVEVYPSGFTSNSALYTEVQRQAAIQDQRTKGYSQHLLTAQQIQLSCAYLFPEVICGTER